MARQGRKSAAQTPAPPKERIYGSKVNPKGSASSAKSAANIKLSDDVVKALEKKRDEYNDSHKSKVTLAQLKAVFRRGAGAYSKSHRPTISGGRPNSRNAWAYARVNKFLQKKAGKPVKKAYVQDDDLLAKGGQIKTLLAPNGKPSNLTPKQYELVRTSEFKSWFGDWENDPENASKVVDDNGEPMVMYHGGTQDFTIFDIKKSGQSNKYAKAGFWFTPLKQFASNFLEGTWWGDKGNRKVYEVFLSIKNPKEYFTLEVDKDEKEKLYDDMRSIAKQIDKLSDAFRFEFSEQMAFRAGITAAEYPKRIEEYKDAKPNIKEAFEDGMQFAELQKKYKELKNRYDELIYSDSYEIFRTDIYKIAGKTAQDANVGGLGMALDNAEGVLNMYREKLKSDGYDGITIFQTRFDAIDAGGLNDQYVALYPEQIKLADGSNTTFDAENPDIRYEDGGQAGEINATNYFNSTRAEFRGLEISDAKEILEAYRVYRRKRNEPDFIVSSKYGKLRVDYQSERKNAFFHTRSLSYYFVSEENDFVIRISDHWSKSNSIRSNKLNCGYIRSCYWTTDGSRFTYQIPSQRYPSELIAGICSFKDFEIIPMNRYADGGATSQIIVCKGCGWTWNTSESEESDKYVCHQCGFDNRTYYDADPIGNRLEKMKEGEMEIVYKNGGDVGDCIPCRQKAEKGMEIELEIEPKSDKLDVDELNRVLGKFGYEAIKKGDYPIGKVAAGMTLQDIARRHKYPIQTMQKSLELGIKTEMEHTDNKLVAEKIALDHLYEDAEYYEKLQKIEKLYRGAEIDYDFNPMSEYLEGEGGRIEMKLYLQDVKTEAQNVLFSDERKLSKGIICMAKINHAKEQEKMASSNLEKNFWQENINIWNNCFMLVQNGGFARLMNVQNKYSLQDVYSYAKGGLAYGNSHAKGGIPLYNKGAASMIEIEGGEGVVKKESMQLNKTLEFEGKKMTACEIVSEINQMTGGVKFKCADVKKIMQNDGKYD